MRHELASLSRVRDYTLCISKNNFSEMLYVKICI